MEKIGIFPGSFDPFTRGHEAIVKEALHLFDRVVIAIGYNPAKRGFLPVEARKELIDRVFKSEPRVEVTTYTTLTGDEARRVGATAIVRSVRNMTDFDYERTIANANRFAYKELSTVIVLVPVEVEHISSSLVRELHAFGRDVEGLLPEGIALGDYLNFGE
jgi:pantetheine-phosphate adenylyltransferase